MWPGAVHAIQSALNPKVLRSHLDHVTHSNETLIPLEYSAPLTRTSQFSPSKTAESNSKRSDKLSSHSEVFCSHLDHVMNSKSNFNLLGVLSATNLYISPPENSLDYLSCKDQLLHEAPVYWYVGLCKDQTTATINQVWRDLLDNTWMNPSLLCGIF